MNVAKEELVRLARETGRMTGDWPESINYVEQPAIRREKAYQPEIDGLRAIAVFIVILCHAQFALLGGGYIGVDVFFVISGYVVSSSIFREQENLDFSFSSFLNRRLKRLAPALYLVLVATIIFSAVYCFPEDTFDVVKNSAFVSVLYSNIYLSKLTGYFDVAAEQQPLLHTWSLSVEEQFYLICPAVLFALRRFKFTGKIAIISLLTLVFYVWSEYSVKSGALQAYYKLHYRTFEFLIGISLAAVNRRGPLNLNRWISEAIVVIGIIVILLCAFQFNSHTSMPGWHALLPCVGTALVIAGASNSVFSSRLLNNAVAVYLGKLSYSLYLWHWPVLFALRRLGLPFAGWLSLIVSLLFAVCTFHLLEKPVRYKTWAFRKTILVLFVTPIFFLSTVILAAKTTDNFSALYPKNYRKMYYAVGHSVFDDDRAEKCWGKVEVTSPDLCSLGLKSGPVNAVLWGDSHAYHQIKFIADIGHAYDLRIHDLTLTMCPPNEDGPVKAGDPAYQSYREACRAHGHAVMNYIMSSPEIKTVFMSAVWPNYENVLPELAGGPTTHGFLPGDAYLKYTVQKLTAAGKKIVFLDDIPVAPPELEDCQSNKIYLPWSRLADCSYDEKKIEPQWKATDRALREMMVFPNTYRIHTFDVFCGNGRCQTELLGVPMYRNHDTGHLGLAGSEIFYRAYVAKHPNELGTIFSSAGAKETTQAH